MKLSIIIVSFNTRDFLLNCLSSIYAQSLPFEWEIVVIDNNSSDGSPETVMVRFPDVRLYELPTNRGFSAANNIGLTAAKGEYCLLLNSDTVILPGALEELIRYLDEHREAAAVGPKVLNSDGTFQRSFFDFPHAIKIFFHSLGLTPLISRAFNAINLRVTRGPALIRKLNPAAICSVDYLLFACVLIRSIVFKKIGFLDENIFFYHEDCEFGYRMFSHGMKIHYYPKSMVIHFGGASSKKIADQAFINYYGSLLYVFKKYKGPWELFQLRTVILMAMAFRLCMLPLGLYRSIAIPGTYNNNDISRDLTKLSKSEILSIYRRVFRTALGKISILPSPISK